MNFQSSRYGYYIVKADIPFPSLNRPDIGSVNARFLRQGFL